MRAIIRFICLTTVRVFFRRIAVSGEDNVPSAPILVVANHPNGLVDPGVLRLALGREVGFLAKSTLFENALGLAAMEAFGAIPVYRSMDGNDTSRNDAMYELCRQRFESGRSIVIFPEGTSHSDPNLKPFKTGAARIALRAASAESSPDFLVLPVGLFYDDKTRFRSRVSAAVGEPIDPYEWVEDYADRGHDAAVGFTELLEKRLAELVLEADSVELYAALVSVAMWTADSDELDVDGAHERARELADAYQRMVGEDPAQASEIAQEVTHFRRMVESVGVENPIELEPPRLTVLNTVWAALPLILGGLPALVGFLASWIPYRLLAPLSRRIAGTEIDLVSSVKALLGLFVLPAVYAVEALAIGYFLGVGWGVLAAALLPVCGYVALRWGELFDLRREVLRGHWLRLTRRHVVEEVIERRAELSKKIAERLRNFSNE